MAGSERPCGPAALTVRDSDRVRDRATRPGEKGVIGMAKSGWDIKYPDSKIKATAKDIAVKAGPIRLGGKGK